MGNVLVSIIKVELIVMKVDFKFAGGNCVRQRLDKLKKTIAPNIFQLYFGGVMSFSSLSLHF